MNVNHAITQLRRALGLKVSYGLRAFAIYIIILGSLGWFLLGHAVERLNDGMRQAAENVMVDSVNILAALLEQQLEHEQQTDSDNESELNTQTLAKVLDKAKQRSFVARIYQVSKSAVGAEVYVTDAKGIIVYDSTGRDLGKNYSQWNDVNLTLSGRYGARTSFISRAAKPSPDSPKAMIVAAPIQRLGQTLGVVSLATPIASLEQHLATETVQMERTMIVALLIALFFGFVLSVIFSRSVNKIAVYVDKMANGEPVEAPHLLDQRLADLTQSVAHLRTQLDGKEYVEDYIHSLTHELKTPITGIQGALELISEGLPAAEQQRFLDNIRASNRRMARLVERMLGLAKLESQTTLVDQSHFDLDEMIKRLLDERQHLMADKDIETKLVIETPFNSEGDRVLISQAIANLLDNAIAFAKPNSTLEIQCKPDGGRSKVTIINQGELIPDYALPKIYERFFSLPSKVQANGQSKSTGLGLSFVKEIMKLHNGRVTIQNHENGVWAELVWPQ